MYGKFPLDGTAMYSSKVAVAARTVMYRYSDLSRGLVMSTATKSNGLRPWEWRTRVRVKEHHQQEQLQNGV